MTSLTVAGGVEVDLATKQDLQDGLDSLRPLPETIYPVVVQYTIPGSGNVLVQLGRPGNAVEWDIRALTIVGADDHTAVANAFAAVYFASDISTVTLQQLRWTASPIPYSETFRDQLVCPGGEGVFVTFAGSGVTAGLSFTITALVAQRARGGRLH